MNERPRARHAPTEQFNTNFEASASIDVVAFAADEAQVAAEAWRRFGRGRHPASLNYGDCMSYATAVTHQAPLLFVGDDFAITDITAA